MTVLDDRPAIGAANRFGGRRTPVWQYVIVGPFAGAALGVLARCWMRLIADEPEFSWDGTVFIVGAFTVAGAGHGVAWAVRRAGARRRWTTVARVVALLCSVPIFSGAGMMMAPTVFGASLARTRTDWPRAVRLVAGALAVPLPIVIAVGLAGDGITPRSLLGAALLALTYTVIVLSMDAVVAPIPDGWRMRRSVRIVTATATVLLVLFAPLSVAGLG